MVITLLGSRMFGLGNVSADMAMKWCYHSAGSTGVLLCCVSMEAGSTPYTGGSSLQ